VWDISHALLIFFIAAGSAVEVKDKQIQTETTETEDQHVQVGSTVLQQGAYATVYYLASIQAYSTQI